MDRVGQCHFQGFEHLSDELVVTILRKALKENGCNKGLRYGEAWASAKRKFQLRTVCRRFRSLISSSTPNLHWHIILDQDLVYMRAMQSVRDAGPKLEGLKLTFGSSWHNLLLTGDQKEAAASVPFLASLLWQGHTVNLKTFSLASPMNQKKQTEEASHHLLSMLAAQPSPESVYFLESGFHFKSPLSQGQQFSRLVDLQIVRSHLSDTFVQSVISKAPQLEKVEFTACTGLVVPEFRGLRLKNLEVHLTGPCASLLINAPSLECLRISSKVLQLKLEGVTKLQTISLEGPSVRFEVCGSRPVVVDDFSFGGGEWHFSSLRQVLDHITGTRVLNLPKTIWNDNAELESFSTFIRRIATEVEELRLGGVLHMLTLSEICEELLARVCFGHLKEIDLQVHRIEQFKLLHMLFRSCPSLEVAGIDLFGIESPITCLAKTVTRLQAAYPKVRIEYEEPQFVTACHLLELDTPQELHELQDELEAYL